MTVNSTLVNPDGGKLPISASVMIGADGVEKGTPANPFSINGSGKQESFALAAANVAAGAQTVYGGDYIFAQLASAYGTITLQVLGPDGTTWQTLISKTAADATGGTGLALGSYAQVRVTLAGTTAASATLSRVP